MEREAVDTVADLLRARADDRWGYVTDGATAGSLYALWQARRRHPDGIVYVSAANDAVVGVLDVLNLPRVIIRADLRGELDYADLAAQVDRHRARPAVVVASIGTGFAEAVDDVRRVTAVLDDLAIDRRWVHADAALSGLPLALLDPGERPGFDFADGADSVTVAAHTFLGAPTPCEVVVVRARATRPGALDTLPGSRSGLAALVVWYALRSYGTEGLRERAHHCRELAAYTQNRLVVTGWPSVHRHPHAFTVTFTAPASADAATWPLPTARDRSRIVCVPGVTRDHIDAWVEHAEASGWPAAAGAGSMD
jgi:histidine decarboxylase